LRVLGHGHWRGRGGGVERGAVLGAQKLQGPRRQDPASVWKPHTTPASQHRELPSVLDGHAQRQTTRNYYMIENPHAPPTNLKKKTKIYSRNS